MKRNRIFRFLPLLALLPLVLTMMINPVFAIEPTINLRSTSTFAILAGTTVINTGSSTIIGALPEGGGNVGLYPGSAFVGEPNVSMVGWNSYLSDGAGIAQQAKADLQLAYDDAAGRTPTTTFPEADNQLGGKTLKTGVYVLNHATTANLTSAAPLILDGEGNDEAVFIFQVSSDLIIGSDSNIILINSARYCRVFWQVSSSATIGTGAHFVGHIFALTSIVVNTNATVNGQLLALNGSVNIHSNVITNALCAAISSSSSVESSSTSSSTLSSVSSNYSNSDSTNSSVPENPITGETPIKEWPFMLAIIASVALIISAAVKRQSKSKMK